MSKYHSGFVSLIGRPNVGKSTLMNSFIGEKIAIVSNKPQTTRNKIQSILTTDEFQIIFIDTPGIHKPKSKLGEYMVKSAETTIYDVDVVLYLIEPLEKISSIDKEILLKLENTKSKVILVINKIDSVEKSQLLKIMDNFRKELEFTEILPISALKGNNIDTLKNTIKKYLPEGPKYFPEDMITDQPERQIISEMIREKALCLLQEEIPHGIAIEIMSMKKRENSNLMDIEANIYCEKESSKGIIIGKRGDMLKEIGRKSRYDMERFLGCKVYLQLWVKVKKGWRESDFLLKNFGYDSRNI